MSILDRKYPFITLKFLSLCMVLSFMGCSQPEDKTPRKVQVKKIDGNYKLYKDGKPYTIKGAAGNSHFKTLKEMGGNTI